MLDRSSIVMKTLREIKELIGHPVSLNERLSDWSKRFDLTPPVGVTELFQWLDHSSSEVHLRQYFHGMISFWDYRPSLNWSGDTQPSTGARRELICSLLGLNKTESERLYNLFPVYPRIDQLIRVTSDDPGNASWYDDARREQNRFYWQHYEKYLLDKDWDSKNVAVLDSTSTDVVSDLQDPLSTEARFTRGLVVGYVQSGKTANFTGIIAKAIDTGYRLIIILAGLQNSLRNQTQRRLDKELVGREILEASGNEYCNDDDWMDFSSYGDIPERLGALNIDRLTTSGQDFRNPIGDLSRLRFHKVVPDLPFCDPKNLSRHPVKLIVIKKNKTPLTNLLTALEQAQLAGTSWSEVPSLIIDDESDQASINSTKPTVVERKKRSAINGLIVEILATLRRSQYVGYTATPFANVFVSPDDAADLFPSDFLASLPRPDGYMGVQDFYDSRETPKAFPDASTNFGCYVRPVQGENAAVENLPRAIDAFVLSGAIKLFREKADKRKYKHHTMLVHLTTSQLEHRLLKEQIDKIFSGAGYLAGGPGMERLRKLWEADHKVISNGERFVEGSVPANFSMLTPYIGQCVAKILSDGSCALVLNGDGREIPPDFDKSSVWRIIVGGAKLSRGYTVEGLTVSYYRRVAGAADTLMQMGRWFGYRHGYRDLVRLYIGTKEPQGQKGKIDLYEAFRGVCDDEEEFRSQLKMYSRLQGEERLTPKQIPPLVPSHMLMPTAKNKMYNAKLLFVNFGGQQKQSTMASTDKGIKSSNQEGMRKLLQQSAVTQKSLVFHQDGVGRVEFPAYTGAAEPAQMRAFLSSYRFGPSEKDQGQLNLISEYLQGIHGDPAIDRWLIVAPQLARATRDKPWSVPGVGDFSIRQRERVGDGLRRYNVFTESRHVALAEMLTGVSPSTRAGNPATTALIASGTAVMLFYPVLSDAEKSQIPTIGFSLFFPRNKIVRRVRYGVRASHRPEDVTVDAPAS